MNKEEIEKEDKEHLIEVLTEHKDYIFEFDDDNIKIEYILDYIRELEFQNTALKAEHNHNITRIKELEQKESILDTATNLITKLQKENEEKDRKMKMYLDIISKNIIETIKDELVQQKNKEIDLKDKQIDLMVEMIDELSEYYTRYWGKNNEFCKEECVKKDIDCKDCIKKYFENLAKEKDI